MTGESNRPPRRGAREGSVIALHGEWLRIQNRLTGAPIGHEPPLTKSARIALAAEGRALERRIVETRSRSIAEVVLKLKLAACPILLSGGWRPLVDSAARDLSHPDPGTPLARIARRRG